MDYTDKKELSCYLHIYDQIHLQLLNPTLKIVTMQDVFGNTDNATQEPGHWYAWLELGSKDAVFYLGPGQSFIIKGRHLGSLMQTIKGGKRVPMVFDQISESN